MLKEIKVPSVGESVTEALLAQWFKADGDRVKAEEPLFVIETDKINPITRVFDEIGYTAWTVGNHEVEQGDLVMLTVANEMAARNIAHGQRPRAALGPSASGRFRALAI